MRLVAKLLAALLRADEIEIFADEMMLDVSRKPPEYHKLPTAGGLSAKSRRITSCVWVNILCILLEYVIHPSNECTKE